MMAERIITLCYTCAEQYKDGFKLTKIPGRTTTEKSPICEGCRKKLSKDAMTQYIISPKRR